MTDIKTIIKNSTFIKYFVITYGLFIVCLTFGTLIGHLNSATSSIATNYVTNYTSYAMASKFSDGGILEILSIFVNNTIAFICFFTLGYIIRDKRIVVGLWSIETILLGLVVGGIVAKIGVFVVIGSLIPHGIFEISALCMAMAYGITLHERDEPNVYVSNMKKIIKEEYKFVLLGISFLALAAIIEVVISTLILIMLLPK